MGQFDLGQINRKLQQFSTGHANSPENKYRFFVPTQAAVSTRKVLETKQKCKRDVSCPDSNCLIVNDFIIYE